MTNLQIKKEILRATKRTDEFKIELTIWTGDGCFYEEGSKMYTTLTIIELEENQVIDSTIELESDKLELFESDASIKILRKEQAKLYKYLNEFFNIEIDERNC